MTSRNWICVINNWTQKDVDFLDQLEVKYKIYAKEVGANGTPHLQCFMIFCNAVRLTALKKLHNTAHWEACKGTVSDNINYCKKGGLFIEVDNRQQGKRSDLVSCVEAIKSGGIKKLVSEYPEAYVKYHSGFEKLNFRLTKPRDPKEPPVVTWLYGKTGTGKTREVVEKEPDLWISGRDLKFWDGYENQEAVLFDDFRKDFCTFHELLRILDRYPVNVNVKGGFRCLNSKRIYITSCFKPDMVYETREDVKQLLRRITEVKHVKETVVTEKGVVTEVVEGNTNFHPIEKKTLNEIWEDDDFEFSDEDST